MADNPNHSHRVLLKSFFRMTDSSDDLLLKIGHSTYIVDDWEICNIVKEAVDCNISAQGIFLRSPEVIRSNDLSIFGHGFFKFRVATKSWDLYDLSLSKKDLDQSKPTADDATVLEEKIDLVGVSVGGYIEVFRGLPQEEIADASPDQVR